MPKSRRNTHRVSFVVAFAVALVSEFVTSSVLGQQAIVTMPSADITPEREFFLMHETQARGWGPKPYWSGTYFLTYGLSKNVELAVTIFDWGVYPGATTGTTTLAFGFKVNTPLFEEALPDLALTITTGTMGLQSWVGEGWGIWAYSIASMRVPWLQTRIAVGASYASDALYGNNNGGVSLIASVEQPIPGVEGLSAVAEWFSGDHELSNLIARFTYHPNHTWIFVAGWKIPTQDGAFSLDEQAFIGEVGLFFPAIGGHAAP